MQHWWIIWVSVNGARALSICVYGCMCVCAKNYLMLNKAAFIKNTVKWTVLICCYYMFSVCLDFYVLFLVSCFLSSFVVPLFHWFPLIVSAGASCYLVILSVYPCVSHVVCQVFSFDGCFVGVIFYCFISSNRCSAPCVFGCFVKKWLLQLDPTLWIS